MQRVAEFRETFPFPRPPFVPPALVRIVALGLIAIGISGALCQVLGWRFGDHVLAADSQSAHLSAARCADLLEYHPTKPDCSSAELAHHADEIVDYRLAAGALGPLAYAAYRVLRRFGREPSANALAWESTYSALAIGAFAFAGATLVAIGVVTALRSGGAPPRWFSDGGVSLVFALGLAAARWRTARGVRAGSA